VVPSSYRLEHVVAGLIERLDGMRRTFPDREAALRGLRRAAEEHLDAVTAELRAAPFLAIGGEAHAAFLRREVLETFLPRFVDAAVEITVAERGGFGIGRLAEPLGRVGLVVFALLALGLVELRLESLPIMWPITLLTLALPFLPDILGRMERSRYEGRLQAMLTDMERIQAHAQLPLLDVVDPVAASRPRVVERPREKS
jgi:hypothetical protein